MPRLGLAHKLLSGRHPDTSPPAGGADPSDGQVATWSAALKAWIAADAAGGVTDHGLLTGLVPDDDHTQYALLSGRSGGQSFIGGAAASEHVTLQSTAHATRGYVRAQDDLQLLSNVLRDAGGTNRLQLATASPHLTLNGDVRAPGHLGLGANAGVSAAEVLAVEESFTTGSLVSAINAYARATPASGGISVLGLQGIAQNNSPGFASFTRGLGFSGRHAAPGGAAVLQGLYMAAEVYANKGALVWAMGGYLFSSFGANTAVTASYGLWLRNFGAATVGTAYGLYIDNQQNATANYILWAGPATPYLRLDGGAAPAGVNTNLWLNCGGTLRRVSRDAGTGYLYCP